jgi:hypothetical protein
MHMRAVGQSERIPPRPECIRARLVKHLRCSRWNPCPGGRVDRRTHVERGRIPAPSGNEEKPQPPTCERRSDPLPGPARAEQRRRTRGGLRSELMSTNHDRSVNHPCQSRRRGAATCREVTAWSDRATRPPRGQIVAKLEGFRTTSRPTSHSWP